MRTHAHLLHLAEIFFKREIFQSRAVNKMKTHVLCRLTFIFENRAVYEIMWKNMVQPDKPQMTIKYRVTIKEIDTFNVVLKRNY